MAISMAGFKEKVASKKQAVKEAFSSKEAFLRAIEVRNTIEDGTTTGHYKRADPRWMNEDLEPTPPEKRTWGFKTYCMFYFGLSFGNWSLGAVMVGIGLSWWQAIVVIFIAQAIASLAKAFNSRVGTMYHIGYPAVCRGIFGFYASYYFVGARAALAVIWYGVQLYTGASYFANMLRAIFGSSFHDIPNSIPESVGITTNRMIAFFLFWLIHFYFCFYRPYQLVRFFWFKGVVMLPAVFGVFIYCMVATKAQFGGALPAVTGSRPLGWLFMHAINSGMGNQATLITNQPDIARWSKTPGAAVWSQVLVQPLASTLSATFGILATAAINNVWGLQLWNPWDLLDAIMDRHFNGGARFAIFLAAFTWTIGILGTNIAANMIPFGSDVTLLAPRYIDMRRGFFLAEFLGYAVVPWKILASARAFTSFLSGYGLFMASVVAIMVSEYFMMVKGNFFVSHLFDPTKDNEYYRYHKGWNIQALIAYLIGIALPFPGFVATLGAPGVNDGGRNLFSMGWILSFCTSFVMYWVICTFWPTEAQKAIRARGLKREQIVSEQLLTHEGLSVDDEEKNVVDVETTPVKKDDVS